MAAEEETRLAAELDFYAAHKTEGLVEHSEKYVVVQNRNVLGFYPSFEDAFRAGVGAFGVTRDFLVKQVLEHEPIYFIFCSDRPTSLREPRNRYAALAHKARFDGQVDHHPEDL